MLMQNAYAQRTFRNTLRPQIPGIAVHVGTLNFVPSRPAPPCPKHLLWGTKNHKGVTSYESRRGETPKHLPGGQPKHPFGGQKIITARLVMNRDGGYT